MNDKDLLNVKELAAWLKVSTKWVYREVGSGRLVPIRVGGQLRFFRGDVEEYLRAGRASG